MLLCRLQVRRADGQTNGPQRIVDPFKFLRTRVSSKFGRRRSRWDLEKNSFLFPPLDGVQSAVLLTLTWLDVFHQTKCSCFVHLFPCSCVDSSVLKNWMNSWCFWFKRIRGMFVAGLFFIVPDSSILKSAGMEGRAALHLKRVKADSVWIQEKPAVAVHSQGNTEFQLTELKKKSCHIMWK